MNICLRILSEGIELTEGDIDLIIRNGGNLSIIVKMSSYIEGVDCYYIIIIYNGQWGI